MRIPVFLGALLAGAAASAAAPPADLARPDPATWATESAEGYSARDGHQQEFSFAVNRQLRRASDHAWAMTLTFYAASAPDLVLWLDDANEMQKGLLLADGTWAVAAGRIDFLVLGREPGSAYGTLRVTLRDGADAVVAQRDFRATLVPGPSYCNLTRTAPWVVGGHPLGDVSSYACSEPTDRGGELDWTLTGSSADHEWVLETWGDAQPKFAALTLADQSKVVAPLGSGMPTSRWNPAERTLTLSLTAGGKRYERVVRTGD